jgi:YgiT-type zinc finger domain-containing protein
MKECPLCGEIMQLSVRDVPNRVPGQAQMSSRQVREWVCPECDYFEDADEG